MTLWLQVNKVLLDTHSKYQHIIVFESSDFWNVLVLDWVIQLTQRDEAAYQEMLAHIPLNIVSQPKNVLIIWGWDGWILRETLRYNGIESVTQCEIDEWVISAAKKFFPDISGGFDDPRTNLLIWDGAEFVENTPDKYDSIIVDSSDPIGPAETLFVEQFYRNLKSLLKPGWSLAIQGESLFLHKDLAADLLENMRKLFTHAQYAQTHVPTYPAWNIGILACSDTTNPSTPLTNISSDIQDQLRYYSPQMHRASFVLPHTHRDLL